MTPAALEQLVCEIRPRLVQTRDAQRGAFAIPWQLQQLGVPRSQHEASRQEARLLFAQILGRKTMDDDREEDGDGRNIDGRERQHRAQRERGRASQHV